jgi:hypothetical protein
MSVRNYLYLPLNNLEEHHTLHVTYCTEVTLGFQSVYSYDISFLFQKLYFETFSNREVILRGELNWPCPVQPQVSWLALVLVT